MQREAGWTAEYDLWTTQWLMHERLNRHDGDRKEEAMAIRRAARASEYWNALRVSMVCCTQVPPAMVTTAAHCKVVPAGKRGGLPSLDEVPSSPTRRNF